MDAPTAKCAETIPVPLMTTPGAFDDGSINAYRTMSWSQHSTLSSGQSMSSEPQVNQYEHIKQFPTLDNVYLRTREEAHQLLFAAATGRLPLIQMPISAEDKRSIKSGDVYICVEERFSLQIEACLNSRSLSTEFIFFGAHLGWKWPRGLGRRPSRFKMLPLRLITVVSAITSIIAQQACTTNFVGSAEELQAAQQAVIKDFANLFLVQKNVRLAFDKYIPGEYINHNPFAQSGRQNALNVLVPALANQALTYDNVSAFAGGGYGLLHYRMKQGSNTAVMDKFRFVGTCIVEHWDVAQTISGRESNPIAFF
ncbi:hypothetical protein CVT24_006012 [Panaeolus cyanescens]|uniref:SnoaL-like domain-containing protein n=1 Tax=Panaeolus cyanescens TaxID=181874 RepID=A0A409YE25_9AGAR|nr:hypothetical protein CVT24_006012 [Panaeolus cyanescens]